MEKINAVITGIGGYVPEYVLNNDELSRMVDTNDEWIMTRIGVKERRILNEEGLGTSYMARTAAKQLRLKNAYAFDLQAACSGFLFAMDTASALIESARYKKMIVIGADKMSSMVDYTDRATCPIFGDGAAAVLVEPTTEDLGWKDAYLRTDGKGLPFLCMKAGGSACPPSYFTIDHRLHYLHQEGRTVFKFAVTNMSDASALVAERNGLTKDNIAWVIPHQANVRIIEAVAHRLELPMEKVMLNIQRYGNTSAATLPLALWDYEQQLKKGDNLIFTAFGAGFTWGAAYMKWGYDGAGK